MSSVSVYDAENGTTQKPPIFTPDDYDTWQIRMNGFFRNHPAKIWVSFKEGAFIPTAADAAGVMKPKELSKYSEADHARVDIDTKALWLLQMSIRNSVIHGFKKYKTAKELWQALKSMYEGTDEVKQNKKDVLKQKYENFTSMPGENMNDQYLRFVKLIDELAIVDVTIENADMIRKFLRSLPHEWSMYSLNIRSNQDLNKLQLGALHGMLSAYQMEIDSLKESMAKTNLYSNSAALHAPIHQHQQPNNTPSHFYQPNPPAITYNTNHSETPLITFPTENTSSSNFSSTPYPSTNSSHGAFVAEETNYFHLCQEDLEGISADDIGEMDINYQMAMIAFRAKNFYSKTGRKFQKHNMRTGFGLDKSKLKCYNCQQFGHFLRECKALRVQTGNQGSYGQQANQAPQGQASFAGASYHQDRAADVTD